MIRQIPLRPPQPQPLFAVRDLLNAPPNTIPLLKPFNSINRPHGEREYNHLAAPPNPKSGRSLCRPRVSLKRKTERERAGISGTKTEKEEERQVGRTRGGRKKRRNSFTVDVDGSGQDGSIRARMNHLKRAMDITSQLKFPQFTFDTAPPSCKIHSCCFPLLEPLPFRGR